MGDHLEKWEDIDGYPEWPANSKNHVAKCMTRKIWAKLKDKQDPASGQVFQQAIFQCAQRVESIVGFKLGHHDCYTTFKALVDPVIESYHGHKPNAKHPTDFDPTHLDAEPFTEDEASRIISTRCRVGRSLKGFALNPVVTKEKRLEVEKTLSEALDKMEGELAGTYYPLLGMSDEDRDRLIEDHFLFCGNCPRQKAAGAERDWPEGRGIFHNDDKTFLAWINEEDHLRIISMQQGADFKEVFERLSRGANEIEKVASFSRDDHFGYITSCPTNVGTGLRASVLVKLPKLSADKSKFTEICDKYHVQIRGAGGESAGEDDLGVFDISNSRRLGFSEVQLVKDMVTGVKALIAAEKELE